MLIEQQATPKTVEGKLIKLILPDFMLLFLFLSAAGTAAVLLSEIIKFPQVLLLIPAVLILAIILSFLRFYRFLSNILRAMGALSFVYEELGEGKSKIRVEFPKPLILFGFLAGKQFTATPAKDFTFHILSDSSKYKAETNVAIQKGYVFDIKITDWRGKSHSASAKGSTPQLQNAAATAVSDIRKEVLESTGVQVQSIVPEAQAYIPEPKTTPRLSTTAEPKAIPKPPPPPSLPPVLERKSVEQREGELRQQLTQTNTKSEKDALQDILFQLEEINKVIKED